MASTKPPTSSVDEALGVIHHGAQFLFSLQTSTTQELMYNIGCRLMVIDSPVHRGRKWRLIKGVISPKQFQKQGRQTQFVFMTCKQ
jgi:hypothetical protein